MIMARGAKTEFIASSRSYMALINNDRAIMRAPEHLPESNGVCVCSSYHRVFLRCNSEVKVHLNCTKDFVIYKYLCKQIIGSGLTNKMIEKNYADKSFYDSCNL